MENDFKHNKKIMISKYGLKCNWFCTVFYVCPKQHAFVASYENIMLH
jgi:hypothetical protein